MESLVNHIDLPSNPWLSIPLEDYEGHMGLPSIGQAQALSAEFGRLLCQYQPRSLVLVGCAGGNGLEWVDSAVTCRTVVLDINPDYVETTRKRYEERIPGLEALACDIAMFDPALLRKPVGLVFSGLILEYVPLLPVLQTLREMLRQGGILGCVLQEKSDVLSDVSPSPFTSLSRLSCHMHLVSPEVLVAISGAIGLRLIERRRCIMPNGKALLSLAFAAE